uniref:Uncharacterized protein n=1 Tax=Callorhinchus milii TaxID=7868 RepID=V9L5D2_CALMI
MSGSRAAAAQWEAGEGRSDVGKPGCRSGAAPPRGAGGQPRWHRRRRRAEFGRIPRVGGGGRGPQASSARPQGVALRPVNLRGNRAPRNTNQFLMHEKYQLMHMRSDSTGGESGADAVELDLDIDACLGVLENARGALDGAASPSGEENRFRIRFLGPIDQEQSLQYFPSEDDVIESEHFMQRDFAAFWSALV